MHFTPTHHEILVLDLSVHAFAQKDPDRFTGLVTVRALRQEMMFGEQIGGG